MKLRRLLSVAISLLMTMSAMTFDVSAHTGDYYSGTYLSSSVCNQSSLGFVVYGSAQTTLLNYNDVYSKAFAWSNITNNVDIRIAMYSSGMPTNNFFAVRGSNLGTSTLGITSAYDSNGNAVSMSANWYSAVITMNTSNVFSGSSNPTQSAAKTFIHEVGHALKLKHPEQDSSLSGHTYDGGRPLAIMNQGFVDESYVPVTVATHDKNNLKAKWGG